MASEKSHRVHSCTKWAEKSIYDVFRVIRWLLSVENVLQRLSRSIIWPETWIYISWKSQKPVHTTGRCEIPLTNRSYGVPDCVGTLKIVFLGFWSRFWKNNFRATKNFRSKVRNCKYLVVFDREFEHQKVIIHLYKCQKSNFQFILGQSSPYDFFLSSIWDFRWGVPKSH